MTERELEAQMIKVSKWQLRLTEMMGDEFSVEMMCSLMSTMMLDMSRALPHHKDKIITVLIVTSILVQGGGPQEVANFMKSKEKGETIH